MYFERQIHNLIKFITNVFVITLFFGSPSFAENVKGRVGIGIGYPYCSVKYGMASHWAGELRSAFESNIFSLGGRVYYNFTPGMNLVLYSGLGADGLLFNTENTSGDGTAVSCFAGFEYFLNRNLTLIFDIGPSYINVRDSVHPQNIAYNTEWIINLGLGWYY